MCCAGSTLAQRNAWAKASFDVSHWRQRPLIPLPIFNIVPNADLVGGAFVGGEVAQEARGASGPELACGNSFARREHCASRQHPVCFDHAAVHHYGPQTYKATIFDDATVQHHHMADEHIVTNERRVATAAVKVGIAMDDGAILNVGARANPDTVHITTDHTIEPDAGPLTNLNIADDLAAGGDEGGVVHLRRFALIGDERVAAHDLALDADRNPHAATDAQRGEALFGIAACHFVQQSGEYAGA